MTALDVPQASIDSMQKYLKALALVRAGRIDELPDDIKRELAQQADGALTAAELLTQIVSEARKR
jgi:hypothetical protein